MKGVCCLALAWGVFAGGVDVALAQADPAAQAAPVASEAAVAATPAAVEPAAVEPAAAVLIVPALTPVEIVIEADLGSKLSKTGQTFTFHLAAPVVVGGVEVFPAGTPGQGEVVHAKKGGGSGAPGELVLAARYLQVGDRQVRLRSLRLDPIVNDKINTVNTINVATAATVPAVALIGFFITGGEKNVAKGTILPAKTAEAFEYGPSVALPAPAPAPAGQGETGEPQQ